MFDKKLKLEVAVLSRKLDYQKEQFDKEKRQFEVVQIEARKEILTIKTKHRLEIEEIKHLTKMKIEKHAIQVREEAAMDKYKANNKHLDKTLATMQGEINRMHEILLSALGDKS